MNEENSMVQGALDRITGRKPIESRPAPRSPQDWLQVWRELAAVTSGIESKDDPRYERLMRWLDVAATAELLDSWPGFCEAADQVRAIMRGES